MEEEEKQYASPMKRIWAWVGVVYMLMLTGLTTYGLSTGTFLRGIGGLLVAPALAGGLASLIWTRNHPTREGNFWTRTVLFGVLVVLFLVLIGLGLWSGFVGLMANFGGS